MDNDSDYAVAKEIVQSGQSDEDWDTLRNGKGAWPDDHRKEWKQYRKYSLDRPTNEAKVYKQPLNDPVQCCELKFCPALLLSRCNNFCSLVASSSATVQNGPPVGKYRDRIFLRMSDLLNFYDRF